MLQPPVSQVERNPCSGMHVLWEASVKSGGKWKVPLHAVAPCRYAQRAFSRNMQGIGPERFYLFPDPRIRQHAEADFRIRRTRQRPEVLRRHKMHLMTEAVESLPDFLERRHDAVYLWRPGVGHDHHLHTCATSSLSTKGVEDWEIVRCRHSTILSSPSQVSTSAERLSTQSPSLQ